MLLSGLVAAVLLELGVDDVLPYVEPVELPERDVSEEADVLLELGLEVEEDGPAVVPVLP